MTDKLAIEEVEEMHRSPYEAHNMRDMAGQLLETMRENERLRNVCQTIKDYYSYEENGVTKVKGPAYAYAAVEALKKD